VSQFHVQTADIRGRGNVVVQVVGNGNVAHLVPHLPSLWLTTYESTLYSEVQSLPPEGIHPGGYTKTGLEEVAVLSPFTRSLTMHGRDEIMADLVAWLQAPSPMSVQVVVGGGGRGKTRLALELCSFARGKDWLAGFAVRDELARFRAQQAVATWGWNHPVLVVVDYAAAKAELLAGWLGELTHHRCWSGSNHPKLRLLLLERRGGREDAWWHCAFGEGGPTAGAIRRMLAPGAPLELGLLRNQDGSEGPSVRKRTVAACTQCHGAGRCRHRTRGCSACAHARSVSPPVLDAMSSPALGPRFVACNTPRRAATFRPFRLARNDCTQ